MSNPSQSMSNPGPIRGQSNEIHDQSDPIKVQFQANPTTVYVKAQSLLQANPCQSWSNYWPIFNRKANGQPISQSLPIHANPDWTIETPTFQSWKRWKLVASYLFQEMREWSSCCCRVPCHCPMKSRKLFYYLSSNIWGASHKPPVTVKTSFQVSLFCPVSTLKSPKGTEFEEYLSNVLRCIIMLYSRMSRCYSNYCNSLCFIFGALPFKYA